MPSSVACVPPDVETRRLGLLDDIVPNLSSVAVFAYAPNLRSPNALQASQNDGSKLGLHVTPVLINSLPDGLPDAFEAARAAHAQAVMLYPDDAFAVNISRIAELATANRLPVLSFHRADVRAGLLLSSGPGVGEGLWRAAGYAAKILRGAQPSELPVGVPYQTDLAINLQTAHAIGLSIPEPVITEANVVIP